MALDYLFELIFFGSLLAISGRFEKRRSCLPPSAANYENGSAADAGLLNGNNAKVGSQKEKKK